MPGWTHDTTLEYVDRVVPVDPCDVPFLKNLRITDVNNSLFSLWLPPVEHKHFPDLQHSDADFLEHDASSRLEVCAWLRDMKKPIPLTGISPCALLPTRRDDLVEACADQVESALAVYVAGNNGNPLVYDTVSSCHSAWRFPRLAAAVRYFVSAD